MKILWVAFDNRIPLVILDKAKTAVPSIETICHDISIRIRHYVNFKPE